jgi:hypothetical protein
MSQGAFDAERFNALMALAEHRRGVRESRMGREWQVTVPLWVLLAGLIAKPETLPSPWMSAAAALAVGAALGVWTYWHWHEAKGDAGVMRDLHDDAYRLALPGRPLPFPMPKPKGLEWVGDGLLWAKLGVALVLTAAAVATPLLGPSPHAGAVKLEIAP